jgi:fucose 4-O-acetylase-like acetyltransferase
MPRNPSLDNAKGIAMTAVILFHILRGMDAAGLIAYSPLLKLADNFAYGFHTQTFLFVSGLLAWQHAGSLNWQLRRQAALYHPYLLWSLITWSLSFMLAQSVNQPVTLAQLATVPILPIGHFWFLLALMAGTAVLALLRSPIALIAGLVVCILLCFTPVSAWIGAPYHLFFMLAGALLAAGPGLPTVPWPATILALAVLLGGAAMGGQNLGAMHDVRLLWVGIAGCVACIGIAQALSASRAATAGLGVIARYSMTLYLLHVLAGAGTRIVLTKLLPDLPISLVFIASLSAAFVLPLFAAIIARRLHIDGALGFSPLWRAPVPATRAPAG